MQIQAFYTVRLYTISGIVFFGYHKAHKTSRQRRKSEKSARSGWIYFLKPFYTLSVLLPGLTMYIPAPLHTSPALPFSWPHSAKHRQEERKTAEQKNAHTIPRPHRGKEKNKQRQKRQNDRNGRTETQEQERQSGQPLPPASKKTERQTRCPFS